jgi:hypothetical protein
MSKLSRVLLESMDRFALDEVYADNRRGGRRAPNRNDRDVVEEYAEVGR